MMMRLSILALLMACALNAAHISWFGDYDTAHAQSLKENKPLMVLLVERGSADSTKMLTDTLMNQPYIEWINHHFVSVMITKGTTQSYPLELLYTLTYPAVFFLTKHELFLSDPIIGYADAPAMQRHLDGLTGAIEKHAGN